MSIAYSGDNITFPDASVQNTAPKAGMVNRIINGGMVLDQRNAGASTTPTTSSTYNLDRWQVVIDVASKFSVQQNAGAITPPAGFINYLGVTSLSAYSVGASEVFGIRQNIEGLNLSDFGWGTADAKTVTLSFWVRSSLTGTFGGSFKNSAGNRAYPFSYTILTANTWEQKTITVAGDTTGTWLTTNGIGIRLAFSLGAGASVSGTAGAWVAGGPFSSTGATSVVGTSGATFYITGVQLEKGSTATDFDYRQYGQELALCQRYYQLANICGLTGGVNTSTFWTANYYPPVYFRAIPTATVGSATRITNNSVLDYFGVYPISPSPSSTSFIQLTATVSSGSNFPTTGVPMTISLPATINLSMSAEL